MMCMWHVDVDVMRVCGVVVSSRPSFIHPLGFGLRGDDEAADEFSVEVGK